MTEGGTNACSIQLGDFDTWTFTATQGDYIALSVGTVTQTTAHFAPWIRLVSSTGALLGNSFPRAGAADLAAVTPTRGGASVVIVGCFRRVFYAAGGCGVERGRWPRGR